MNATMHQGRDVDEPPERTAPTRGVPGQRDPGPESGPESVPESGQRSTVAVPAVRPRAHPRAHLLTFAAIGVASTLLYTGLYAALAHPLGAQAANAAALLLSAVANTAANRRLTFGVAGRAGALRHQAQGLGVLALALLLTSGSLGLLHAVDPHPARWVELTALTAANAAATVLRYALLRWWVFAHVTRR